MHARPPPVGGPFSHSGRKRMSVVDEYLRRIEGQIPELRKRLAELTDGSLTVIERRGTGREIDKTKEWAAETRATIGIYQAILAQNRWSGS
jgi:hypothetical protein